MSDWQPPPNPPGPPPAESGGQGGFVPPGPPPGPPGPPGQGYGPPGQGYAPPPSGGPPPPPGQGYGYPPPGYPQAGYPPGGAPAYGRPPFAGFWVRVGAALIDGLIVAIIPVIAGIALAAGPKGNRHLCTVNDELKTCQNPKGISWAIFAILLIAGVVFAIYYFIFLLGRTGQTIGRKALGIKVVDKLTGQPIGPGRAFVRYLVQSVASGAICGLGYLWMLWDEEKQTWHDKVANSYVITT